MQLFEVPRSINVVFTLRPLFFGHSSAAQLPSLVSFSLSLTPPELLTLTFDTTLQSSECDVSKLTLQNSSVLMAGGSHTPEVTGWRKIARALDSFSAFLALLGVGIVQEEIQYSEPLSNGHIGTRHVVFYRGLSSLWRFKM